MVHVSVKNERHKTSPALMHRDYPLPLPPEKLQAAPPAPEVEDPLYDSVKEIKERLAETHQDKALSNTTTPENQESLKLERTNPLYVSANEVKDPPLYRETKCGLHEVNKKDEDIKTRDGETSRVLTEPLYSVIRKGPSVKKPPQENPGGENNHVKHSTLQKIVLPVELNSDNQKVDFIISMEQKPPNPRNPSERVDSMLTHWKKRSIKSSQQPKDVAAGNVGREFPPLVPVKRFDIESETAQHANEEDTEISRELPA
ncbi:uncharacterized protein LOC142760612 [Rhinoderma darwinii]|uniref:uncharacterized protein LOC142760612 n=1 Tax=Rhinoderma darwinii TaxID=43563 RepID=UPI003F67ABE0